MYTAWAYRKTDIECSMKSDSHACVGLSINSIALQEETKTHNGRITSSLIQIKTKIVTAGPIELLLEHLVILHVTERHACINKEV